MAEDQPKLQKKEDALSLLVVPSIVLHQQRVRIRREENPLQD
jgi:hypothetical protein